MPHKGSIQEFAETPLQELEWLTKQIGNAPFVFNLESLYGDRKTAAHVIGGCIQSITVDSIKYEYGSVIVDIYTHPSYKAIKEDEINFAPIRIEVNLEGATEIFSKITVVDFKSKGLLVFFGDIKILISPKNGTGVKVISPTSSKEFVNEERINILNYQGKYNF